MSRTFHVVLLLLFFSFNVVLPACGEVAERSYTGQNVIQVTGRVYLVGSEPFTELIIGGSDIEWHIARGEERLLLLLQHRVVTVEGIETVEDLWFASGLYAGERRTLSNISIINIE
jgi:hypothetical protein